MDMMTVLDVGCGAKPRGDVNVDLFRVNNPRHCNPVYDGRKIENFVQADAHYLPFRDDSFDMVLVDNCLEHCKCPFDVLRELMRISRIFIVVFVPTTFESDNLTNTHIYHWLRPTLRNLIKESLGNVKFRITGEIHRYAIGEYRAVIMKEVKK